MKEMSDAKKYLERLEKLNKDADKRTVYECIDRPIRKLVYHINRIGFKTRFSCCGFSYEGEEEPKTHNKVTYIQFYEPRRGTYKTFIKFAREANGVGWEVSHFTNDLWIVRYRHPQKYEYRTDDGIGDAIHDYECPAVAIAKLEEVISKYPSLKKTFKIVDGNRKIRETIKEWQVKPKKDKVFDVEDAR